MTEPISRLINGYSDAFSIISRAVMDFKRIEGDQKAIEFLEEIHRSLDYEHMLQVLENYLYVE